MIKPGEMFKVTFIGEMVEILAKSESEERGVFIVRGYLLDYDEEFYYMGENPLAVNAAIKRDVVSFISIIEQLDPGMETLVNMPEPDDDEVM